MTKGKEVKPLHLLACCRTAPFSVWRLFVQGCCNGKYCWKFEMVKLPPVRAAAAACANSIHTSNGANRSAQDGACKDRPCTRTKPAKAWLPGM